MKTIRFHIIDFCLTVALGLFFWRIGGNVYAVDRKPRKKPSDMRASAPLHKPALLKQAPADYPAFALSKCLEGTVWLSVLVSTSGAVSDVKTAVASDSTSGFIEAAINAAWKAEFAPAIVKGKEKAMWATMTYRFTPPENCEPTKIDPIKPTKPTKPQQGTFVAHEVEPKFIERVKPEYPKKALENCIGGTVWVQALVDKTGKVRDVKIAKGSGAHVGFEKAAERAAKKSRFSPAIQSGRPTTVWAIFSFEFKAPENCQKKRSATGNDLTAYDVAPKFISRVLPEYPVLAKRAGIMGTVWVGVFVERNGKVTDVRIDKSSGANAGFEDAAMEAAWKCRFSPATKDGKPVAVWVSFPFEFKLRR